MKLNTTEQRTFINHAFCECGGEFKCDKDFLELFFSNTADGYHHVCDKCGKEEKFPKRYPETITVECSIDQDSQIVKTVQTGEKL